MSEFTDVWQRITNLQGQTFLQKTGRPFTYTVAHGSVLLSTANRQLARSQFARRNLSTWMRHRCVAFTE